MIYICAMEFQCPDILQWVRLNIALPSPLPSPRQIPDVSVHDMFLSRRVRETLLKVGIVDLRGILEKDYSYFSALRGMSKRCADELQECLFLDYGFSLKKM